MSFKDRPFSERFQRLGDEAEGIFESVYPQGFTAFGLRRPPINLGKVPPFVRFMPDYLTAKGLVEVQGFGKDQTAKFKTGKLDALHDWHMIFRVDFFLWDSTYRRYGWVRLPELDEALMAFGSAMRFENDGNPYWALPANHVPVVGGWVEYGQPLAVTR